MRRLFPAVSIRRLFLTLALFLTACSTDSCGCEGFEQRTFPANKIDVTIPAVGQARVTSSGLDYVESQVPYLISQVLPDGLNFCIPRDTSGNPDLCVDSTCDNGSPGCQVGLDLEDQTITTVPSDTLEIDVVIGDINERLNFDYDATLFTVSCYVQLFKKGSSESTPATVAGNVPVRLFVDQGSDFKEVGIDVGDVTVNLEDVDFKIHGRGNVGDTITCEGASLVRGLFRGRIEDEIRGALTDAVDGIKRDQLCRHCGTGLDDCPSSSNCASDGICQYSAAQCVPRTLGVEGRLDIGGLLGEFVREPRASVDLLAKGADLARVDTGVSVGLRGGFEASSISDCIPVDPTDRPAIRTVPASQSVTGNTRPGGGPFMLGVGLHKSAIEQVLWSAWGSGATCLEIDDEDVMLLTTTAFSLVAPSLRDLAGNADSAVLAVVANKHPTVELGANTVRPEGDSYVVDDPLLRVLWEEIDFHVFTYAQDRFVRMFTLRVDLDVPVAVSPDGSGNLLLVIPDLEDAITLIEPRRLELLSESPDKIRDIVPTLLGLAAPQISDALPESFTLPEFLGFRLDIQEGDITSVDNDEFVAVFADLARTNQPFTSVANTLITAQEISYDDVRESGFVRPQVRLGVRGYAHDPLVVDGEYEFSWRVDGGLWSLYHRTSELVIGDAVLAVQGEHVIEVRARRVGEPGSADPVPARTKVTIEWTPEPTEADAEAELSPPADLELAEATATLSVEPDSRPSVEEKQADREQADTAGPSAPSQNGWKLGCSSTDARASGVWLALFVLLVLASRRRWRLLLLAAGVFAAGCGGCKGELRTNSPHRCLGEGCAVDQDCTVDSDCSGICPDGNGGICEAGSCVCIRACDPGCEEDSFCCPGTSECVPFGDLCAETTCDPGYEPGVTDAQPDRDSCELQDFSCDCVPLPPVPVGWHGPFTSIDSDGDLTVVATYNDAYGDLMLGTVTDDGAVSWHWVDGVPSDAPIEGDPNGPRGGRTAQGPDVGTHTAVAVATGHAHVFYRDEGAKVLKWGRATFDGDGSPEFESAVLDDTEGSGMWTAAVTTGSQIHVVYAVPETAEGNSEVRHVVVDANATPAGATPTVLASEAVVDQGRNFPAVAGAFFDLTATGGTPFLVYWNGLTRRVGRTQFNGSAWAETNFLAVNTGPYASGSLGSDDQEHVAFQQSGGFRYSRFGDTTSMAHDGLYDFGDEYWNGTAGEDSSMRLDGSNIILAYQDAFDRVLLIGESPDGTDWTTERHAIEGAGTGFWVAMTRRGDRFVADMVVDRREDPPAYVRITPY